MPKQRRKGGDEECAVSGKSKSAGARKRRGKSREMSIDRGSVASEMTHMSLDNDDLDSNGTVAAADLDADVVGEDSEAVIERKLNESLDNYAHKNVSVRVAALKIVSGVLSRYYVPGILSKYVFTLSDVAERALKKGPGEEGILGARLTALIAAQLGDTAGEHFANLRNLLLSHVTNPALPGAFRAIVCEALSLSTLLVYRDPDVVQRALGALRGVWTGFRAGVHIGGADAGSGELFAASLSGWAQLLPLLPTHSMRLSVLSADLARICNFLEANQMDIRVEAGEVLALLYEIAREADENFRPPNHQQTMETLDMLATDPERHRGKKDRRLQKSTFRQIYAAVIEGETQEWKVKFDSETLVIDSYQAKVFYESLCSLLRGGVHFQLRYNVNLRAFFGLGPASTNALSKTDRQLSKAEMQAYHAMVNKFRKQVRGRQRDKKAGHDIDDQLE